MSVKRTFRVYNPLTDAYIRLRLGLPDYGSTESRLLESAQLGTGCYARALWIGRKHVVALTYSQWVTRAGACEGDRYQMCDDSDAGWIRRIFGDYAAERALDVWRVPVVSVDGERIGATRQFQITVWVGEDGQETEVYGRTLRELSSELSRCGYDGPSVRVPDATGFTAGWVSAKDWTYE